MVERARATGAYADLAVGSLEDALAALSPGTRDLVVAADVLVYVGDLAPVFGGVARALGTGGLFVFTAQAFAADAASPRRFALGEDLRFVHAKDYVEAELGRAGFDDVRLDAVSTRTERGVPVPGSVAVARRP